MMHSADKFDLSMEDRKPRVGFICVHNSCRSQMAEAIARHIAADIFESYSAGTHMVDKINQDAVRIMKDQYDINIELTQSPKLIEDILPLDVVITMGCNVNCPILPCQHREDWELDDPSGKGNDAFLKIIAEIEKKIRELVHRL
ncbi:MAG: arsenate reductase ArsC [Coriobacteriia bacterium]|nr:arsenate reductase ArsC [Coriobacteriia bacterium]